MVPFVIAAAASAFTPSTEDLAFMVGDWRVEGTFNPGAPNQRIEAGTQSCAFVLDGAYVRCERRLVAADGTRREQATFHNYNPLYKRFEHLFISSNWPTKVIGHGALDRKSDAAEMTVDMEFSLPDGRTERLRSVERYASDRFESVEQLRIDDGAWRINYRLTGIKATPK